MDDNLRDVAIALITVAGGLLTALLVTRWTTGTSKRLERERVRRELYATFIHAANEIRDAIRQVATGHDPGEGWADNIGVAQRALLEIRMVAPSMARTAGATWEAMGGLMKGVANLDNATALPGGGAVVPITTEQYGGLDATANAAIQRFVDAAATDLSG